MTTTLDDLIARLETATGPDGELDRDIDFHINRSQYSFRPTTPPCWEDDLPRYTASIDAAETTALKGWRWSVGNGLNGYEAHCFRTFPPGERDGSHGRGVSFSRLDAPTPAIALMTVLLKARKTEAAA